MFLGSAFGSTLRSICALSFLSLLERSRWPTHHLPQSFVHRISILHLLLLLLLLFFSFCPPRLFSASLTFWAHSKGIVMLTRPCKFSSNLENYKSSVILFPLHRYIRCGVESIFMTNFNVCFSGYYVKDTDYLGKCL